MRQNQTMSVGGGSLNIPAAPGDLYGGRNDAANLVMRDAPDGPWVATAKLNFEGTNQYQQAGMIVYGDDSNFTKFGRIAHSAATNAEEKFEFIYENAGTPRNDGQDSTTNIPRRLPGRLRGPDRPPTGRTSSATTGSSGGAWALVGRPAPLPANAKIGLFAFSNDGHRRCRSRRSTRSRSTTEGGRAARASTTSSTARPSTPSAGTRASARTRTRP